MENNIDDVLLAKMVAVEHDGLRAQTGQDVGAVPAYSVPKYRPVAYTMAGNVD